MTTISFSIDLSTRDVWKAEVSEAGGEGEELLVLTFFSLPGVGPARLGKDSLSPEGGRGVPSLGDEAVVEEEGSLVVEGP